MVRGTTRERGGARAARFVGGGGLGWASEATGTGRLRRSGTTQASHISTSAGATAIRTWGRSTATVTSEIEAWSWRWPETVVDGRPAV